ncbi:predicted protein [Postia placenta Mad-698-R]|uniref:Carbohydrate-binding module family 13 protein n=1 Tax=Postia placenta MAD-698-R-SB12 TaxID=670580 RepID=A0A1X6NHG1_9APHY|nr:carbohydrate-binding module family 13 protein [Postia placenta MAD-698-R-SB12]EED84752.1 predicted protein [Postia placenta Mad-698-R]OSX68055.1 carbohydrate-binding module family 13 protein [Postia placenta MAD-698-R-SB12]
MSQLPKGPWTKTFFVKNVGTGSMLDLNGASAVQGTRIQGYQQNYGTAQTWSVSADEDNNLAFMNANTNTYAYSPEPINGGNVVGSATLVRFKVVGDGGKYQIKPLDANDLAWSLANGNDCTPASTVFPSIEPVLLQVSVSGNPAQQWVFETVG